MAKEMTHSEFAAGLRQIADFLEAHPEIDLPEPQLQSYSIYTKERAATALRALSQGSRCEKVYADAIVRFQRMFGPVTLEYIGTRSNVCEQIKVGTRVVPEHYVAPVPATEGHTVPEHEEAVYEWRCAPILSAPETVEVPDDPPALTSGSAPILEGEYVDVPF